MGSFVLTTTGCGKVSEVTTDEIEYDDVTNDEQDSNTNIEENNDASVEENNDDVSVEENKDYTEEDVIQYFEDFKNTIKESDTTQNAKEKIINSFITITDFMFYDGEIYGITYDQLQEQSKIQLQNDYLEIDSMIESKFPNYKDTLSSKYDSVKTWINEKYNLLIEKGKEGLSEETLNNIDEYKKSLNDAKESLKDASGSIYEDEKVKVKSWYETYRQNH